MVDLSPNIPVIALNINNLKLTIKRKRWPEWIKKIKIQVCCHKKLISNIIGKLRVKIWKLYTMKKTKKIENAQMAILISDNLDLIRFQKIAKN